MRMHARCLSPRRTHELSNFGFFSALRLLILSFSNSLSAQLGTALFERGEILAVSSSSPSVRHFAGSVHRTQYFASPFPTTFVPRYISLFFSFDGSPENNIFWISPAARRLASFLHCAIRLLSLRPRYARYRSIPSFGSRRLRSEIFPPDHVVKKKRPPLSSPMTWA